MQIDGGHEISWTAKTGASLWAFGFAADWHVTGPATDIAGEAVLWPRALKLGPMSGEAGWPLVAAILPGLPIECTGHARFAAVTLQLDRAARTAEGVVTTAAAECARVDGQQEPVPTPALHAQITTLTDAVQVLVTPQDGARVALATALLTASDRLVVTIHRAGAALVPGMPNTADTELDLPLSVLLGK